MDINVEGTNWNPAAVAEYVTEKDFVDAHISDEGTYPLLPDKAAREKALKQVYKQCVPKKLKDK